MNTRKKGYLLTILTGTALIGATAAHAAGSQAPANATPVPAKSAASAASVRVKLGYAMLEEYHGGNPDKRKTIVRGAAITQKAKNDGVKKRS